MRSVETTVNVPGWAQRVRRALRKEVPTPLAPPDTYPEDDIATMLRSLGMAMLEVGEPTNFVNARLVSVAARYTTKEVRLAVLPTVLMVQIDRTRTTELQESTRATVRLDQAGRIDDIFHLAECGAISPVDAVAAVSAARELPPRFGAGITVFGYAVTTVGFGMLINPTWAAVPADAILGALVGLVLIVGRRVSALAPIQPTVSALLVTVLAGWFVADIANEGLVRVIAPALIGVLPGIALTIGATELASGEMIAGSSRVVYGVAQLMLLAFGVVLGERLTGPVEPQQAPSALGAWALYAAILLMAVGFYLFLSAPRGSWIWLALALGVALIGQQVASLFADPLLAGAIGALIVVPFAMFAARFKGAPPGIVMILAAFWALVPGALSFIRLSEAATGGPATFDALQETGAAILAIALGTLVGWSMFRAYALSRSRG